MKTCPPIAGNVETVKVVKNLSRMTYGKEREVVEQEILARAKLAPSLESAQPQNEPKFNL